MQLRRTVDMYFNSLIHPNVFGIRLLIVLFATKFIYYIHMEYGASLSANEQPTIQAQPQEASPGAYELAKHKTGFYRYAPKDQRGLPQASRIYWNTTPPTPCHDLQHNSVFLAEYTDGDIQRYDISNLAPTHCTHLFNQIHASDDHPSSVRPVQAFADYSFIKTWLMDCETQHNRCHARKDTDKLKIVVLIDVNQQRLIRYIPGMKYLALSYVWGGVKPPRLVRPQELPGNLPATIRHAMRAAISIGVPYLWVDALCIDQQDQKAKAEQLPLMDVIYEQAFATIIALGDSANSGLPGVDDGPRRHVQLVAEFGPVKLMSRCPSLYSQIQSSRWSTRSWTYQEGLLSRRCIYFSQYQVYFHCNTMLCSEDSPSISIIGNEYKIPEIRDDPQSIRYVHSNSLIPGQVKALGQGPFGRIAALGLFLREYVQRQITEDTDAIHAVSALLLRLNQELFPGGFIYGLPLDEFVSGLLWEAESEVSKRPHGGFPSWSWASWIFINGGIRFPCHTTRGVTIRAPLLIQLDEKEISENGAPILPLNDLGKQLHRLWAVYYSHEHNDIPLQDISGCPYPGKSLYIDGPVLTLTCTYNKITQAIGFKPTVKLPKVLVCGQRNVSTSDTRPAMYDFLVVKTMEVKEYKYFLQFSLIMLDRQGDVATRLGFIELRIEGDLETFWNYAQVTRKRFWLV